MNHVEIPLDIEDIKIENVEFKEHGEIIIRVTSTLEGTYCHQCGQKITDSYGHDREITLRHLSILGRPTYIQIRPKGIDAALVLITLPRPRSYPGMTHEARIRKPMKPMYY